MKRQSVGAPSVLFALLVGCGGFTLPEGTPIDGGQVASEDSAADTSDAAPASDAVSRVDAGPCSFKVVASSSAVIGLSGGTLTLKGGWEPHGVPFSMTVPPGALDKDYTFVISELKNDAPPGVAPTSPVYRLEPAGVRFDRSARLNVTMPPLSGTIPPLVVYAAPDEHTPFTKLPDSYTNAGFMNASLSESAGFLFVGAPSGASPAPLCP